MKRRDFSKYSLLLGMGVLAGTKISCTNTSGIQENSYQEPPRKLPAKTCEVVVAGGGTAGVVAAIAASSFIDSTTYGDLAAHAGANYTEPNDYAVCNSIGMGNVDITTLYDYFKKQDGIEQSSHGYMGGMENQIIRVQGSMVNVPQEFRDGASEIGISMVTTTVHDNYLMFIKFNMKLPKSPTDRDTVARAELELRQKQFKGVELFRKFIPGCEKAFIARTSPTLNIRRGRCITCDYDISHEDVIDARHFDDEVFVYGFHDSAPQYQVKEGGTYGIPYRALCVKGIHNLYASGMMITSDRRAHMSTRNTVSCFGQGQATGTAAALCAQKDAGSRDLPYSELRSKLEQDGVYFES